MQIRKVADLRPATEHIAFSPDGKYMATAGWVVKIYEFNNGNPKLIKTISDHKGYIHSIAFSPDGRFLASGSDDKTVKIYSVSGGEFRLIKTLSDHRDWVRSVSFSPDGRYLASGSDDNTVKIYSVTGEEFRLIKTLSNHRDWVRSVSFSPDGRYLASGSDDNTVKIYSVSNGEFRLIKMLSVHSDLVYSVSFSPDGKYLASGSGDKTVNIYSVSGGEFRLIKTLSDHSDDVNSVSFSPDDRFLASGSNDNTVKIYSVSGGEFRLIKTLSDHSDDVYSLSFSPDGKYLASGSGDQTVNIYSVSGGEFRLINTLSDHSDWLRSVSFSPDGKYWASGSNDNTVNIYSVSGGKFRLIKTLKDHSDYILSVSFSPDGRYLATGGWDGTIIYKLFENSVTKDYLSLTITSPSPGALFNTSEITVQGTISSNIPVSQITVTVGGKQATLRGNQFSAQVSLHSGANNISVVARSASGLTVSKTVTVFYSTPDNTPPVITITNPPQLRTNDTMEVEFETFTLPIDGRVTDNQAVSSLVLKNQQNQFRPIQIDASGYFHTSVNLRTGINRFSLIAYDLSNNKTEKTFTVVRRTLQITGKYYALLIGIDRYDKFPKLRYSTQKVDMLAQVLRENYVFEDIITLKNPTYSQIVQAFMSLANRLASEDKVLIFWSGHGVLTQEGVVYFPAKDANQLQNSFTKGLLIDQIKQLTGKAKHIVLIMDACYSGAMTSTQGIQPNPNVAIQTKLYYPSVKVLYNAPNDRPIEERLDYVQELVNYLATYPETYLSMGQIVRHLQTRFQNDPNYTIDYRPIANLNSKDDQQGDFIFIRRH